jgi:uncharacterized protein YjaZ
MTSKDFYLLPTENDIRRLLEKPSDERSDQFRNQLMRPFSAFWESLRVPMKAKVAGGYDVAMASGMLGVFDPKEEASAIISAVDQLKDASAWTSVERALEKAYEPFVKLGFELVRKPVQVMLLPGNPRSVSLRANKGFSGMGGIPGFVLLIVEPNAYTISHIPHLATHEFSHQVKLTVEPWRNDISLGEYLILEGLADSLVRDLYGDAAIGPWITDFDADDLLYSTAVLKQESSRRGFNEIRSYMFGDLLADEFGYDRVGLSHAAGYAVGYSLVQQYLRESGDDVYHATLRPSSDILKHLDFSSEDN